MGGETQNKKDIRKDVLFVLVRLKGFEPPTFWFVAKHSIQLSYSRKGKRKNKEKKENSISLLVRLKGFEPPTFWFVAKHSIQLSYSRIFSCPLPQRLS